MPLEQYKKKRDFKKTPEPEGGKPKPKPSKKKLLRFVVQEHHATSLHWDFRLERDAVLVSWAVPKGIPPDPKKNHLAVHVEDHPLSYIDFAGDIPEGNYGAGAVSDWNRGTYGEPQWSEREAVVGLHGRLAGGAPVRAASGRRCGGRGVGAVDGGGGPRATGAGGRCGARGGTRARGRAARARRPPRNERARTGSRRCPRARAPL